MKKCLKAKNIIGKESISPSITVVSNNAIYDFGYVDAALLESPSNRLCVHRPPTKKRVGDMCVLGRRDGILISHLSVWFSTRLQRKRILHHFLRSNLQLVTQSEEFIKEMDRKTLTHILKDHRYKRNLFITQISDSKCSFYKSFSVLVSNQILNISQKSLNTFSKKQKLAFEKNFPNGSLKIFEK